MDAVLVAEPETAFREFIGRHLERDGFEVLEATAADEALELAERAQPDIVVLGCALPDAPPVDVCTRLREGEPGRRWNRNVPVIMLGDDRRDPVDCVRALARGADDYVAAPLLYEELLGRIRAVLRRSSGAERDRLHAGELVVDRRTRDVRIDGRRVALATKEYELLLEARVRADACLHERTAFERGVGLSVARPHQDARQPCVAASAKAGRG